MFAVSLMSLGAGTPGHTAATISGSLNVVRNCPPTRTAAPSSKPRPRTTPWSKPSSARSRCSSARRRSTTPWDRTPSAAVRRYSGPFGNSADTKANYEVFKKHIAPSSSVSAQSAYVYYNPPVGLANPKTIVDNAMGTLKPGPKLQTALDTLKGTQSGLKLDNVKLEAMFFPKYTLDSSKPLIK